MAEETEEGVKDAGTVSLSVGSLTGVDVVGEEVEEVTGRFSDWAYRLQGWVAKRMRREERSLGEKKVIDVVGVVFAIAVRRGERERGLRL